MESDQCQLVNITNEVGEKLLELPASQFRALVSDDQCGVFECVNVLGQECLLGLSNFNGEFLVSVVNQV